MATVQTQAAQGQERPDIVADVASIQMWRVPLDCVLLPESSEETLEIHSPTAMQEILIA